MDNSKVELETRLVSFEEIPDGLNAISVMDHNGDTKHIWNPKNSDEVEAARTLFNSLVEKGFRAFRLNFIGFRGKPMEEFNPKIGKAVFVAPTMKPEYDGEIMSEFDPSAENIQMIPQLQGG